ncbi:thioredoxin family protein [Sporosarcina sp. Marseille-Q4063]|uniref:thioredoxin family protein n=1 Tax=Sporosarcina sp. Marseille-Q4063 TaxID=2810514 RepID=UPI001BB077D1|nr:thioredoxin family protein [Sporosarcina sp. Marseille-Q4063]QUW23468.1 thioredoxin family protein [Sporosarcina sp. Marseille-Q4063]
MKKLLVIGGIIVAIFILIVVLTNKSNETKLKDNPYGTEKLEQSTINLIGNENYNNIILPDELAKKIKSGDPVTAYFFSPDCPYCMEMTPVLMPIAKEMDVTVYQYNLLEFNPQASSYGIRSTPTLIHFRDGKEVGRMVGAQPADNIRLFFEEYESE